MTINILIVDDSSFIRSIIKNILNQLGITEVYEASDGVEAITKYEEVKPDLVFMDIIMPNKTGLEALREIISKDPNAKIVIVTSVGEEKVIKEANEIGAINFVQKPFMPEDFKKVISEALTEKPNIKQTDRKIKTLKK